MSFRFANVINCGEDSYNALPLPLVHTKISSVPMLRSFGTSGSSSPKAEKDDDTSVTSIDRIGKRSKASIDKLKNILSNVKTRPGDDGSLNSIMKLGGSELAPQPSRVDLRIRRLQDMGLLEDSSQSNGSNRWNGSGDATAGDRPFPESYMQHDSLTSTKTTVKFDRDSRTTTVTIVASVRDSADDNISQGRIEKPVIMAARALGRSAMALEEKANALTSASKIKSNSIEDRKTDDIVHEHERLVFGLEKAKITEGTQVRKGHYAGTPFRPVYKVKLELPDGSATEGLLKPATPGDVHCRWGNASSDWVAYQVGRLLGTDMVPPAAMRRDVKVGDKSFPLATLLYLVPQVKPLTQLSLQEWGGELPAVFVSNAHILDALLGSCPRARNMFTEGPSWTQSGARQAMLLDHPMGPGQGKLHPMWTQRGQIFGIKCVSGSTLAQLRNLDKAVLTGALGKWVFPAEIDHILERMEQVLAYFDGMLQSGNRSLLIV